jgi:three-Cys-motif partner protein
MAPKSSQANLFEHSEAKVRLLGEYLKRYLSIISNDGYTEKIRVYDLFCGPGIFENDGEGSPLVILRTINDLHFMNVAKLKKFPKIECFFNDIDANKIDSLKTAIDSKSLHYSEFCNLNFSSADYEEKLKKILAELKGIRKQKSFIFIDPYGYQNIKASQIKDLLDTVIRHRG